MELKNIDKSLKIKNMLDYADLFVEQERNTVRLQYQRYTFSFFKTRENVDITIYAKNSGLVYTKAFSHRKMMTYIIKPEYFFITLQTYNTLVKFDSLHLKNILDIMIKNIGVFQAVFCMLNLSLEEMNTIYDEQVKIY
jgi:hypothetical protein